MNVDDNDRYMVEVWGDGDLYFDASGNDFFRLVKVAEAARDGHRPGTRIVVIFYVGAEPAITIDYEVGND